MGARTDNRTGIAVLAGLCSGAAALSFLLWLTALLLIPSTDGTSWSVAPLMMAWVLFVFCGPVDRRDAGGWTYPIIGLLGVLSVAILFYEVWIQDLKPAWSILALSSAAGAATYFLMCFRPRPSTKAWRNTRNVFCMIGASVSLALTWPVIEGAVARMAAFVDDPLHGGGAEVSLTIILLALAALVLVVVTVFVRTIDSVIDSEERREREGSAASG
jgi:hypothetical protein